MSRAEDPQKRRESWYVSGVSSLSDPTDATSPEHTAPGPAVPASGDELNELLRDGTRVAFRGSVFIDGQHYPHGERLADLCAELDLEYKQSVTKSTCDLLISDDLDAQDTKAKLARKYDKPVIPSEDFADWAQERLTDAGELAAQGQSDRGVVERKEAEVSEEASAPLEQSMSDHREITSGSGDLDPVSTTPETGLLRTPVLVGAVFLLLILAVLVRRRKS